MKVSVSPMTKLCILFLALFLPRAYAIAPIPPKVVSPSPATPYYSDEHFTPNDIDELLASTTNTYDLRKLISCESENTNVARMDSNHKTSYGVLQFQASTWVDFQSQSHIQGSPMNVSSAIAMADWAISHGYLHRWTCAKIQGLI